MISSSRTTGGVHLLSSQRPSPDPAEAASLRAPPPIPSVAPLSSPMAPASKSTKKGKTLPDANPKPDSKSPKPVNEIDEIFQATKSKKRKEKPSQETEQSEPEKKVKRDGESKKIKKKNKKGGSGQVLDEGPEAKARRRRTNDGLAIYSAEELGFANSNAGGTPLCPFDCDCCF